MCVINLGMSLPHVSYATVSSDTGIGTIIRCLAWKNKCLESTELLGS